VKIGSRSGALNDLIITSRRGLQRSIQFVAVRTARKLATQIGLDSQSGPRFDADLTEPVTWRAGFVTVKVRRMTKAMTHGLNELKNIEKKQNTSSAHRS
jgi:hypothetical protein